MNLDSNPLANSQPTVTIGIPVYNEANHIGRVLNTFLSTDYSNLIEIIIADGGSTDETKSIVQSISSKDNRVKLIDNPEKFQSFALNRIIDIAKGDIFVRADGHCYYDNEYITKCVEALISQNARNVGGAQRYKSRNLVQSGIALAVKSPFGNGGAKYMDTNYNGFADTVFLGCFWLKDLKTIGGFNTQNITNQDSELNLRLIEFFGDTIYVSSEIKCWYYPRDSIFGLVKQYFRYGRGRYLTSKLHPQLSPLRGKIPFIFILFLSIWLMVDIFSFYNLFSFQILLILTCILTFESIRVSLKYYTTFNETIWDSVEKKPNFLSLSLMTGISLFLMHTSHFFGFSFQSIKSKIMGETKW